MTDMDPTVLEDALRSIEGLPLDKIKSAMDWGANSGPIALKLAREGIDVLAVEPCQARRLAQNIEIEGLQRRVWILQAAVGVASPGSVINLRRAGTDAMVSTCYREERSLDEGRAPVIAPATLKTFFGVPDFLKIDIEGGEWDLFRADETLGGLLPETSWVSLETHGEGEFFPENYTGGLDLGEIMTKHGYAPVAACNKSTLWHRDL